MTRFVVFLLTAGALFGIISLRTFRSDNLSNAKFDYLESKKMYEVEMKERVELEKKRVAALMPKPKVEKAEEEGPKFELVLDTPELKLGAKLYAKCVACHGKLGQGKKSQKAPKIGGQYPWYVSEQIKAIQTGERVNKVMMPYVKNLSDQDIEALGIYLSKLPWQ